MREKLLQLITEEGDLPPMPDIILALEKKINDTHCDLEDIARLIETEPVLSGRLLKLANSVIFGGGREQAYELGSAVLRLGVNMVLDLAYTLELPKMFSKPTAFNRYQFWKHSLAVAFLSRSIAKKLRFEKEALDNSYLAGLMHEIGVLVFDYLAPDEYNEFLPGVKKSDKPLEELEKEQFGINHCRLGAKYVQQWWPVAPQVVKAIRQHHSSLPVAGESIQITHAVFLANQIANEQGIRNGLADREPVVENVREMLNYSADQYASLLEEIQDHVKSVEQLF